MEQNRSATPPGWPADLPGPGTGEAFASRVVPWLLDRSPPEVRQRFALRRHPAALAHVALNHCNAAVAGQREAYRSARRQLVEVLSPEALAGVMVDLEAMGHELVRNAREVALVSQALEGRHWQEKL
jgi:hypothetical protein